MENENYLRVPYDIEQCLPIMVRNELAKMSAEKQEEFIDDFQRKQKSVGVAYLLWFCLGCHYGYMGKWGMQFLFWITLGGLCWWLIIDIFRIPKMIQNVNKDTATDVMRNLKMISSSN